VPQPDLDEDEMKATFNSWDKDGDGLISANDLREVVASFGEEWSDENVNDMIYYKKNNGVFSFEVRLCVPTGGVLSRADALTSSDIAGLARGAAGRERACACQRGSEGSSGKRFGCQMTQMMRARAAITGREAAGQAQDAERGSRRRMALRRPGDTGCSAWCGARGRPSPAGSPRTSHLRFFD